MNAIATTPAIEKKYMVTVTVDPYHAGRCRYTRCPNVEPDYFKGSKFVLEADLTHNEALKALAEIFALDDNMSHWDDDEFAQWLEARKEELGEDEDESDIDVSWYEGPGYYEDYYLIYLDGNDYALHDIYNYEIDEDTYTKEEEEEEEEEDE